MKRILRIAIPLVLILLVVAGVDFKWTPAPARFGSHALAGSAAGSVFESEILDAEVTLAGLSWSGRAPEEVWVRASVDGSEWTEWIELPIDESHGPDPSSGEAEDARPATDPVYFGPVSHLQYRIVDTSETFSATAAGRFHAETVETSGRGLSIKDRVVRLLSSVEFGSGSDAEGVPGSPSVIPRETWGGDKCLEGTQPRNLPNVHRVDVAIVHHAGNNTYSSGQEALDLIYAFCSYHVSTRGWWDIAYNFLVDRYGNIYEGRRGSIEEQVRGGHTRGFNAYSVGVAMVGNFEEASPTAASVNALEDFLAWRLNEHHIPASGVTTLTSLGSSRWEEGVDVEFHRIAGHRDASATACPGTHLYSRLPTIRTNVAADGEPKFSLDFAAFDPIVPGVGGDLLIHAPPDANWTVSATQRLGSTVWQMSGTGPRTVSWNPDVEPGPYTIRVDMGSLGIHEQVVQVGSYEWPFVDDEGTFAVGEIEDMWNRGVTQGCSWNEFCPKGSLTRGELATFIARAMDGADYYPPYRGYYDDVADGWWYTAPIEYLVDMGVLPGSGTLGVDYDATRVLVVDLILNALGETSYPAYQGYFSDVPEGMWYTPKVELAHELGIALGRTDPADPTGLIFAPEESLNREEAAAFIMRGLE